MRWRNQETYRKGSYGEKLYKKRKVYSDDGYIFISDNIPDSFLETHDEEIRKLGKSGVGNMFRDIAKESGKHIGAKGDWQYIRSHNMRKYFNTTMRNAGADTDFVEYLMGHNVGQTKTTYFRGNPEKLKRLYMKYVPFLSFADTEVRTVESAEYKQLREENAQMQSNLESMQEKLSKIEGFESQFDEYVKTHMDELVKAKVREMLKNTTEDDIQGLT